MTVGRTVLAATVLGGTTAAGVGATIARRLTTPAGARRYGLPVQYVSDVDGHHMLLFDRTDQTSASGAYSVWIEGGGLVRLAEEAVERGPGSVGREITGLFGITLDELAGRRHASWSGVYFGDPEDAGLHSVPLDIETKAGKSPAWLIPSSSGDETETWAIHIHGLGSSRAGTLRGVQVASDLGLTSLVVTYRNSAEGPVVGTGRSTLGTNETEDVRAALEYARVNGASKLVLFGWSMGAAIALQLAYDDDATADITALVLDSPVLDWVATIKANCRRAGLPSRAGALAVPWLSWGPLARGIGLEDSVDLARFDWLARARDLVVPTLILHGTGDTSSPFALALELVSLRPDVIQLEAFEADHTMPWNSEPDRWRSTTTEWLSAQLAHD